MKRIKILIILVVLSAILIYLFFIDQDKEYFSFVVLPDTQFYSQKYPDIFESQTKWIVENKEKINIEAVITLGDIVQDDDEDENQWMVADRAYKILDDANILYSVLPGNHDITDSGATEFYNKYFPASRFNKNPWYGGNHNGTNRNNYTVVDLEETDFVIVSIEYCPPNSAVSWAKEVFKNHSDKIGILATHAFIDENGEQSKECKRDHRLGDNAGKDLWDEIVVPNENIQIVMNGHFHHKQGGVYRTMQIGDRTVHQMMSNYQDFENGGNGFLRILKFQSRNNKVKVTSYSPYVNKYLTDSANKFSFTIEK